MSSIGADGRHNLAPFSFFNAIASKPPLLMVSINQRADGPKDTLRHIRETQDFVINIVDEPLMERMVETSGEWAPEIDEFALTHLTPAPSERVKSPRVAEAPVSMGACSGAFSTSRPQPGDRPHGVGRLRDDLLTEPHDHRLARWLGSAAWLHRRARVIEMQRPKAPKPDAARDG